MVINRQKKIIGILVLLIIILFMVFTYCNMETFTENKDKAKVEILHNILKKVCIVLKDNNIPHYIDCGTLLGCVRENSIMEHDTDVDVTVHLSMWNKLNSINFEEYGLKRTRTFKEYPPGYLISVKLPDSDLYCDIYANPAFPKLTSKVMYGNTYPIPVNSELYLTQLYGNWKVPDKSSGSHAKWPDLFYKDMVKKDNKYYEYWDKDYDIKIKPLPLPPSNFERKIKELH